MPEVVPQGGMSSSGKLRQMSLSEKDIHPLLLPDLEKDRHGLAPSSAGEIIHSQQ